MRSIPEPTLLAIDPGTKEMGVAIFQGDNLEYYGVKTINRNRDAAARLKAGLSAIKNLVERFHPSVLVMEKSFFAQSKRSSILNVLTDEIQRYAFNLKIRICGYAPTAVKKITCGSGKATKAEVAKTVASLYPELARHLGYREEWKRKYWHNMFDAVAIGIAFQKQERTLSSLAT